MAHGVSLPLILLFFLSLTTRTPSCHKGTRQDGALPLSGHTPASGILGTMQESQEGKTFGLYWARTKPACLANLLLLPKPSWASPRC